MTPVASSCLVAGGSFNDAEGSNFLRSELPALTAAKASLATVVTSLLTVLPHLQLRHQPPDSMRSPPSVNQTVTKLEAVPSHAAWSVTLSRMTYWPACR